MADAIRWEAGGARWSAGPQHVVVMLKKKNRLDQLDEGPCEVKPSKAEIAQSWNLKPEKL